MGSSIPPSGRGINCNGTGRLVVSGLLQMSLSTLSTPGYRPVPLRHPNVTDVTDTDVHDAYEDHASDPMADSRDRCAMQGGRLGIEPPLRHPDHVDLEAAIERKVTVAEVTFCNGISVAEHVALMIPSLVRDYLPSHKWVSDGGWNIVDCVERSYDLEQMDVGTIAAGRIGLAVLRRQRSRSTSRE
jgi:hypothetical protein